MIKNKLKELLSDLKKFKVKAILTLNNKEKNDRKIFYPSPKLIASDLGIDEAFKSMHQSIMTTMKSYASKNLLDVIIMYSIKVFEYSYKKKK